MLLKNPLGVLRRGSGRTERIWIRWWFPVHAEALEAFRTFFQQPARRPSELWQCSLVPRTPLPQRPH